ncbi:MAG: glycosyltransferase family 2 protein [Gemmatimonadetes bacterium]|nr:glycosyltransferase family 2 protein [Gemmatimonadota bacterium]MDA1102374.1 glycosyltransferase family 2 protein [Gemmatimonadota bacterium]
MSETFQSLSVVLPTLGETTSLTHTIDCLIRDLEPDLAQILIIVCERSTSDAMKHAEAAVAAYPHLVSIHWQDLPYFGGAVRKAFEVSTGSHTILMASDLETRPEDAPVLVAAAKAHPEAVITASRWLGGGFKGYNPVKLIANWLFQRIFAVLYWTDLSDMTFGYRILPTHLTKTIQWEELRHPFVLETIVKPLRLGVKAVEVPTSWTARVEGESVNPFMRNFEYFRPGLRTRFMSRDAILGKHT